MKTQTQNSPFLRVAREATENRRAEYIVDVDAFARALQGALLSAGVASRVIEYTDDAMPKWRSSIEITEGEANGLRLLVTTDYASTHHNGRVSVSGFLGDMFASRPNGDQYMMPLVSVSSERPLAALARDITRRVIEPSVAPMQERRQHAQTEKDNRALLDERIAELQERFPGMLRIEKNSDGLSAQVMVDSKSGQRDYFYFWGRIDHRGSFHVDRIQDLSMSFLIDLLALGRRHYPAPGEAKHTLGAEDRLNLLRPYVSGDDGELDKNTFLAVVADRINDDLR